MSKYVIHPNASISLGEPRVIPSNLRYINKSLNILRSDTFSWADTVQNLSRKNKNRDELIKYIMILYYGAFGAIRKNLNVSQKKRQLKNFHLEYLKLTPSNRSPNNNNMITSSILWSRLDSLSKDQLTRLSKVITW